MRDRTYFCTDLWMDLAEFHPKGDEREAWMLAPHKLLKGSTPMQCLGEGRDDEVRALVAQLKAGAFV